MIMILRMLCIPDYAIPFRLERIMIYMSAFLNGFLALILGYVVSYCIERNLLFSVKAASCMFTIGFHLQIVSLRYNHDLIRKVLFKDQNT